MLRPGERLHHGAPSDGGLYRAGRGVHSTNFEFPGYCVLRTN
jgi:hypothetical protein